ncbi:MAG: hypothetical protein IKF52_00395 [Clostridia bacterium]|nr:hypothetical protein [Clostridia bacterium]
MASHFKLCPHCGDKTRVSSLYWKIDGYDNIRCCSCRCMFRIEYTDEDKQKDDEENRILDEALENLKRRKKGEV